MVAPEPPLGGVDLQDAVCRSMAAFHESYHHRRPLTIECRLLSDGLLACVMGGVSTEAGTTMIALHRKTMVQESRSAFQVAMQDEFISEVERLSGRHVAMYVCDSHFAPGLEIELFLLAPAAA